MDQNKIRLSRGATITGQVLNKTEEYTEVLVDSVWNGTNHDWQKGDKVKINNKLITEVN